MDYHEAANFLFDLRRFRSDPGTEGIADLLAHLGDPHDGPTYVQIAGSNGKGSTARMVDRTLREAGLDVGLYTSPHLDDVRDRIRVNDRPVPKAAVTEYVTAVREHLVEAAADGTPLTFFEALTGLALWHFGREDVDVAVLEVGIGGRYDATSVVDPAASAVTTVALEHTEILGDTVEEIARDKAQVAPTDAPLVTAATGAARTAVREEVGDLLVVGEPGDDEAAVTVRHEGFTDAPESRVTLRGPDWSVGTTLGLLGRHQARNAGVAAALVRQVTAVDEPTLARGLRAARWPGRFEVMARDPLVVLDGAHNPDACGVLAETLTAVDPGPVTLVFGAMHDKDHAGMIAALPTIERAIVCAPATDRAADPDVLAEVFDRHGVTDVRAVPAVEDALAAGLEACGPDDRVLVTGSIYTVGEARRRWTRTPVPETVRSPADRRAVLERVHAPPARIEAAGGATDHHVLRTRLLPGQATTVRAELRAVGGECVISGVRLEAEEAVDAALLGTHEQFRAVLDRIAEEPGLSGVRAALRRQLGLTAPPSAGGPRYPWQDGASVMGILNITPDSFHDGGEYNTVEAATARAERMVDAGVDILDVGGESTRPGADPVPPAEERDRVVPVIEALAETDALVSIDTRKAAVAEAALEAGADILNDVSGLEDPGMRWLAAEHDVPAVVMHSIETPVNPDRRTTYDDVVDDVIDALTERVLMAEQAGLDRSQIIVDPGLGFGKSSRESFELLGRLDSLEALGCPILVGHSHKSMFGRLGYGDGEREHATVAASALAVERGADIVRVHDGPENVAAVRTALATADPSREWP